MDRGAPQKKHYWLALWVLSRSGQGGNPGLRCLRPLQSGSREPRILVFSSLSCFDPVQEPQPRNDVPHNWCGSSCLIYSSLGHQHKCGAILGPVKLTISAVKKKKKKMKETVIEGYMPSHVPVLPYFFGHLQPSQQG